MIAWTQYIQGAALVSVVVFAVVWFVNEMRHL